MDISNENIASLSGSTMSIEENNDTDTKFTILDILNWDCMNHIFNYVPVICLIKSEVVSKKWRGMVNKHLQHRHTFDTSDSGLSLNISSLQRFLSRAGKGLRRLKIDGDYNTESDSAEVDFGADLYPNLEEFEIKNSNVKYFSTLLSGCKKLKTLLFWECKGTDELTIRLINSNDSGIENLTVLFDSDFTGNFLIASTPLNIKQLSFFKCKKLKKGALKELYKLPKLTTLRIDGEYEKRWTQIPDIIPRLTQLEELSLRYYGISRSMMLEYEEEKFCQALSKLTSLKCLHLRANLFITDIVMKQIAESCKELVTLNVAECNGFDSDFGYTGVSEEGVSAVWASCTNLIEINVSGLEKLKTDVQYTRKHNN